MCVHVQLNVLWITSRWPEPSETSLNFFSTDIVQAILFLFFQFVNSRSAFLDGVFRADRTEHLNESSWNRPVGSFICFCWYQQECDYFVSDGIILILCAMSVLWLTSHIHNCLLNSWVYLHIVLLSFGTQRSSTKAAKKTKKTCNTCMYADKYRATTRNSH